MRVALVVLFAGAAVASVVDLVGGPDLLGEAKFVVFGLLVIVLFGKDLTKPPADEPRGLTWAGFAAGVLLVVTGVAELLR